MPQSSESTVRIVTIKFRDAGKQYDFNAQDFDLKPADRVIVETDRGRALGIVVLPPRETPRLGGGEALKSVLRPATDEDLALAARNASREEEAFRFCQKRIAERRMEMKLVRAEYLFDGSKIIFYFTADGRVDFRDLVKDLAHYFHTRIEMRQIGVRDEAKLTGGIGICGRELCCCTFLTDFAPVSVKMAKEQGLALNPNKISGQCGRLLCCLAYEFETYCEMKKGMPKCGRKVQLEGHQAQVVDQNVLAQTLTVKLEDGQKVELTADQMEKGELPETASPAPGASAPPRREERPEDGRRKRPRSRSRGPRERDKERPRDKEKDKENAPRREKPPAPSSPPADEGAKGESTAGPHAKKKSRNRRRPRRK